MASGSGAGGSSASVVGGGKVVSVGAVSGTVVSGTVGSVVAGSSWAPLAAGQPATNSERDQQEHPPSLHGARP